MLRLAPLPPVVCGLRVPVVKPHTGNSAAGKVTELALDRRRLVRGGRPRCLRSRAARGQRTVQGGAGGAGYVGSHVAALRRRRRPGRHRVALVSEAQADRQANLGWLVGGRSCRSSRSCRSMRRAVTWACSPARVRRLVRRRCRAARRSARATAPSTCASPSRRAAGVGRFVYLSVDEKPRAACQIRAGRLLWGRRRRRSPPTLAPRSRRPAPGDPRGRSARRDAAAGPPAAAVSVDAVMSGAAVAGAL